MSRYLPVSLASIIILFIGYSLASDQPQTSSRQDPNNIIQLSDIDEPNEQEPNDIRAESPAAEYHNMCKDILQTYIEEDGLIDYTVLKRQRLELKKILNEYDNLSPNEYSLWSEDDKKAFWLNAYNIQMMKIICDNYPLQTTAITRILWGPYSLRHIKDIWTTNKFYVMDEEFILKEIEQHLVVKQFNDPRLFLAITYSSASSPDIPRIPFTGENLDKQIDNHIRKFLKRKDAFKIDHSKNIVWLSAIFQGSWHGKEFVEKFDTEKKFKDQTTQIRAVLNFVINYLSEEDVSYLELENYKVRFMNYDWMINDTELRYQFRK